MENEIEKKEVNKFEKLKDFFKDNIKIFLSIFIVIIIALFCAIYFNYHNEKKNEKISEKYIKAGIYLSSADKKNSKKIYEEIVQAKNKFYSPLALGNIIENELENDNEKVLKLFKVVEDIKMSKNDKDLVKLKKALYLKKHFKDAEGNKLLQDIISENSIWKDAALEVLKQN